MTAELSAQEKIALITANLQEVLNPEIIEDVIIRQNRPLELYWGTATTGRPHCGYFVPMLKIAQFLAAGCRVKVLLADIHAFLDNLKAPIELVNKRAEYYRRLIEELLKAVGVPTSRLEFVLGSSYQKSAEYTMDLFKMSSITTEHDAKKAGAEVVKQVSNAPLSGLIYPLMQALDEEYLGVDAQFGGLDQRKIFTFAKDALPRIGYRERAHLMNPMVPGLHGGKMSSSDPDSKIDLLDSAADVRRKIKKCLSAPREVDGNGLIAFVEYVLLPAAGLAAAAAAASDHQNRPPARFVVPRPAEAGGDMAYESIADVKADYAADVLTPQLLKAGVSAHLEALLAPIRAAFDADEAWQALEKEAYPPPPPPEKKKKKIKDKGSRYPNGAAAATATAPDATAPASAAGPTTSEVSDKVAGLKVADDAAK